MKQAVSSPDAPKAIGPYSQAVRAGQLLFVSGQVPRDPASGRWEKERPLDEQVRRVFSNLALTLRAAGADLADVVNVYIKVAEFYVNGAESIANGGVRVVQEAGKVLDEQAKKLQKVVNNPGKAASDCVQTLWDCVRPR